MNLKHLQLTLEQEFKMKVLIEKIGQITLVEARVMLIEITRQNMIRDNIIKDLLSEKNPK